MAVQLQTPQTPSPLTPENVRAQIAAARSFLFVPGDRPDRFEKARRSGADLVILDLEDGVPPQAREQARSHVRDWLAAGRSALVRINAADTAWFEQDLSLSPEKGLLGFVVPKATDAPPLRRVASLRPVVALIETAAGVIDARRIARTPGVVRLAIGTIDLALDLDLSAEDDVFDPVRLELALASRAAGIAPPIDGIVAEFDNADAITASARRARALGLSSMLAIHPAQLRAIHEAFRPTQIEIERAKRIVAADAEAGGAAVALDGAMVDRPMVMRAQRTLARSMNYEN